MTKPIKKATIVTKAIEQGELDKELLKYDKGSDELQEMQNSLANIITKLTNVAEEIRKNSHEVETSSLELENEAQTLSESTAEMASSTEEVSSAIEEMTANIHQNIENTRKAEELSIQALDKVEESDSSYFGNTVNSCPDQYLSSKCCGRGCQGG